MSEVTQDLWSVDAGFRAVLLEAERRGITTRPLGALGIVVLGGGRDEIRLCGGITGRTSHLAVRLAASKMAAKRVLCAAAIPTPEGEAFDDMVSAREYFRTLGRPMVLKPVSGNLGQGVCTCVEDESAFVSAWREAARISRRVLVETMTHGRDIRVLVVGDQAVAATERVAPTVTGDGRRSVAELIDALNDMPERGQSHEKPLTRIRLDLELLHTIGRAGCSLDSVLPQGRELKLRYAANMSCGAEAIDVTDELHPTIATLAVKAAQAIGLDIAGVDMIVEDISRPWCNGGVNVIELNATPGLRMHLFPGIGKSRPVHDAVLDYLFP